MDFLKQFLYHHICLGPSDLRAAYLVDIEPTIMGTKYQIRPRVANWWGVDWNPTDQNHTLDTFYRIQLNLTYFGPSSSVNCTPFFMSTICIQ
mmetsp:Transcript_11168/g.26073  ORF Transcript_11168/g.26073 Transcript_11168/m.26073 type:complete len:92 (+) Transcript_11168:91-366(+)